MKTLIMSLLIALGLTTSPMEMGNYYPRAMVVTQLEKETDTVICVDGVGLEWEFNEIDDWEVGDVVAAIMCDNGTPEIYDDYFVEIRFSGYINPIEYWEY